MVTLVKFNNVDVTEYIKNFNVTRPNKNKPATCNITFSKEINTVTTISSNTEIEIWRNLSGAITDPDDKIFHGYIETFDITSSTRKAYAEDKLTLCKRASLNIVYLDTDPQAGKISSIFEDIVETQVGGLTANVTDTGTTLILERFRCLRTDALERMRKLAEAVDYQFYYDPVADEIVFEPNGFSTNLNSITQNEAVGKINWKEDKTELCNNVTVFGGRQLVRTTESFSGDDVTTVFKLSRKPVDLEVQLGGTIQSVGVSGTGTYDVDVDYETGNLTFATPPTTAVDNIVVDYSYSNPIIVKRTRPVSISKYGETQREFTYSDITTREDGLTRADKILDVISEPFKESDIKLNCNRIKTFDIKVGQKINIIDTINSIDDYFLILEYTYTYPATYDTIKIGDEEVRFEEITFDILDRIKRIEETQSGETDLALEIVQLGNDKTQKTYTLTATLTLLNDSAILGNTRHSHASDTKVIDYDFDGSDWSSSEFTVSQDTTPANIIGGTGVLEVISASDQTGTITSTQTIGDLTDYTTDTTGVPTTGLVGVWIYKPTGKDVNSFKLRIGSSSSDYLETDSVLSANHLQVAGKTDYPYIDGWNYVIFDLTTGLETGTIDWENVDYIRLELGIETDTYRIGLMSITNNEYSPSLLGYRPTYYTLINYSY